MLRLSSNFGILAKLCLVLLLSTPLFAQTPVECVRVVSKSIDRQVRLPGELSPYLSVPIYARVAGFVDRVEVDRGSVVKKGQVLATLVAPETEAQIAEATSKGTGDSTATCRGCRETFSGAEHLRSLESGVADTRCGGWKRPGGGREECGSGAGPRQRL